MFRTTRRTAGHGTGAWLLVVVTATSANALRGLPSLVVFGGRSTVRRTPVRVLANSRPSLLGVPFL